ncbi:MAG TPA: GDSL-type esterase/lipase family protein [Candidatus Polarisedimenticolia bacterium]|nr:GDSL-type esterase/lipase family protein [Candidatus Polarisedimenticolia bacterium]
MTSILLCRCLAVGGFLLALGLLTVSVLSFPPVLTRFVLVDGTLASTGATAGFAGLALAALAAAGASSWSARRLWRRAAGIDARSVEFRLLAALFGAVVYLLLMELGVRVAFRPEAYLSGDDFWIHRFIEREPDKDVVFRSANPINRHDPELGWVPIPGHASDGVHVNSHGARGDEEYPLAKPAGEKRIVVVGDSFTFGEGVPDDEVYTALLQRQLDGVRVINLGVLGYGTDQQYLRLRRDGFAFDPDLVILAFFGPNAERNILSFRDSAKPMFRLEGDGIRLVNVPVPDPADPATILRNPLPACRLGALLQTMWRRAIGRTRFAPQWEVTRRILDAAVDATRSRGVPFLLVYFPDKQASFWETPHDTEIVLSRWAGEHRVPFLSVRPAFLRLPRDDQRRVWHGHYTPFGNRVVASAIAEGIRSSGALGE